MADLLANRPDGPARLRALLGGEDPISVLLAATAGIREVIARIRRDGSQVNAVRDLPGSGEFTGLVGSGEVREIGRRFASG